MDILVQGAKSGLNLHTIRFDYEFEYASPYNTTDIFGLKTLIKVLTQVRNVMSIQYFFNVEEKLSEQQLTRSSSSTIGGKPVQNTPLDPPA